MRKIEKSAVLLSFLSLWMISYINSIYLEILGFVLILTFGILHGTNDILIYSSMHKEYLKKKETIIGFYIGSVLLIIGILYFFPSITLLLFILISAYHFGEQYWITISKEVSINNKFIIYFSFGSTILLMLLYLKYDEAKEIIFSITHINVEMNYIKYSLLIFFTLFTITLLKNSITNTPLKKELLYHYFYLLVFFVIFKVANLIWGFTIFFIFWHSIPSLESQIKFLYGDTSVQSIYNYIKKGFIFWCISIIGLVAIYCYSKEIINFNSLFFSFLTAITFPHVVVISKMFKK